MSRPTGRRAVRYDNHNIDRAPAGSDWDLWVPATAGRNLITGDAAADWLDRHGERFGYAPDEADERYDLGLFLRHQAARFETAVTDHLRIEQRLRLVHIAEDGGDARDIAAAEATVDAMADQADCVVQAVLWNPQHLTYGIVDLLIRADIANRLFGPGTTEPGVKAAGIGGGRHYICVDIKYTTLRLLADGSLSNGGSFPAYKQQLHIYNRALGRIQGHLPARMFLLARGWTQNKQRGTDSMDRLGPVEADETVDGVRLSEWADRTGRWIRRVRAEGHEWNLLPPTVPELAADAGSRHLEWGPTLRRVAEQARDLTVLYHVGAARRDSANRAGMVRWDDPAVTSSRLGVTGKHARRLDELLATNRSIHKPAVRPAHVRADRHEWGTQTGPEFYVDFETVNDLADPLDQYPQRGGQPMIFMIGCGHAEDGEWQYQAFTADQLNKASEARIVEAWQQHMADTAGGPATVFHWTGAEPSAYAAARRRHDNPPEWEDPGWYDFHSRVMAAEPVTIRGAHSFALKTVTTALWRLGLIGTAWPQHGPSGGQEAMCGAWWCQQQTDDGHANRLSDVALMNDIRRYNETDCRAIYDIVSYLRDNH